MSTSRRARHGKAPLRELWLTGPGATLIEIYARLNNTELEPFSADQAPDYPGPGTAPTA